MHLLTHKNKIWHVVKSKAETLENVNICDNTCNVQASWYCVAIHSIKPITLCRIIMPVPRWHFDA